MPYVLPIGPRHAGLPGPLLVELEVSGATILDSAVTTGFFHTQLERRCQQGTYAEALELLESQCPSCSLAHGLAFCEAVEALAGIEVPSRGRYLRTIYAELERISSHLLWLATLARILNYQVLWSRLIAMRRPLREYLRELTGSESEAGAIVVGGVRYDIPDTLQLRQRLQAMKRHLDAMLATFLNDLSIAARLTHVGHLTADPVVEHGALGPVARAAGLPLDVRRQRPYAAYGDLEVRLVTQQTGDTFARTMVRLLEVFESVRVVEEAATRLPEGPIQGAIDVAPPEGEIAMSVESPRGEELLYLAADGSEKPARVHLSTASQRNITALPLLLPGADAADAFLLIGSLDLCISCVDR